MLRTFFLILILGSLTTSATSAGPTTPGTQGTAPDGDAQPASGDTGTSTSDITNLGSELLEKGKEAGKKAWDATREIGEKALETSRGILASLPAAGDPVTDLRSYEMAELARTWDVLFGKLDHARLLLDEIEDAPESAWFGEDKGSLRKDFIGRLDELVVLLDDASIFEYRARVDGIRKAIEERRQLIRNAREARLMASQKSGYDEKIDDAERDISDLEDELRRIERDLQRRLRYVGVDLDLEQIEVLLSRVDSDDIIQMAAVFQVLRRITEQLKTLIEESGESIDAAKRYYGMHVVLLEAVTHLQTRYIQLVETRYVPRVVAIAARTEDVSEETRAQLRSEKDAKRRTIYQKNLAAQTLTLRAAKLYVRHLQSQRDRVSRGLEAVARDLALARNTYKTVNLSADLFHLLEASQDAYRAVLELQVPELVPFENVDLKRKYEELSVEIARTD
jgi:hypothetical protein